ncbi:MAG: SRPBCC domain-containing protein [Actinomycetota bacterium]
MISGVRYYDASIDISASPIAVWNALTAVDQYPTWDSGVVRVEGTVALHNKLAITSAVSPDRAFAATVVALAPPDGDRAGRMVWRGGMPLRLFTGERTFTVMARDGGTHVDVREEFSGPMLGLIWRSMPDLQPSFDQFVAGLRAHVEATKGND